MERARRQDPSGPSLEALTAEWREHALLTVDRELDVIRGVLSRADNGFRFGNVTIAVFDVAAKKVLQAMHDGVVPCDLEGRQRSM